jgi:hypothetical protein
MARFLFTVLTGLLIQQTATVPSTRSSASKLIP